MALPNRSLANRRFRRRQHKKLIDWNGRLFSPETLEQRFMLTAAQFCPNFVCGTLHNTADPDANLANAIQDAIAAHNVGTSGILFLEAGTEFTTLNIDNDFNLGTDLLLQGGTTGMSDGNFPTGAAGARSVFTEPASLTSNRFGSLAFYRLNFSAGLEISGNQANLTTDEIVANSNTSGGFDGGVVILENIGDISLNGTQSNGSAGVGVRVSTNGSVDVFSVVAHLNGGAGLEVDNSSCLQQLGQDCHITVRSSSFSDNVGAGIDVESSGNTLIVGSNVIGNDDRGVHSSGSTRILSSTISGNTSSNDGGGIYNTGNLTIANSTISGNQTGIGGSSGDGGGIYSSVQLELTNSTVTGNSVGANGSGGGIYISSGSFTMNNSIVANSSSGGDIVNAGATLGSNNIVADGSGGLDLSNGNVFSDPMLGPLQNNGGITLTHAPLPGSPAIGGGDNTLAMDPAGADLQFDQRGTGFARVAGARVDIGALEVAEGSFATLDGNDLVISDFVGTDDEFEISCDGSNYVISLVGGAIETIGVPGVSGSGTSALTVPKASIPAGGKIIFNTGDGDDNLAVDFGDGSNPFPLEIEFNGQGQHAGTPGDTLSLKGAAEFDTAVFNYVDEHSGSVDVTGSQSITYTGLEPISSSISATNVVLNYANVVQTITVSAAGAGQTTVDSDSGEVTTFNNPTGSLTINGGTTNDAIDVEGVGTGFDANLVIVGNGGTDNVWFKTNVTDIGSGDLEVATGGSVTVSSGISTNNGDVAIRALGSILLDGGVNVGSGNVRLVANNNVDQSSINAITASKLGVRLEGSSGNIHLCGDNVVGEFAANNAASGGSIFFQDTKSSGQLSIGQVSALTGTASFAETTGVSSNNGDVFIDVRNRIFLDEAINAGSSTVRLVTLNDITQDAEGIITANELGIRNENGATGGGSILLTGANEVDEVALNNSAPDGSVSFHSTRDLTIGSVAGFIDPCGNTFGNADGIFGGMNSSVSTEGSLTIANPAVAGDGGLSLRANEILIANNVQSAGALTIQPYATGTDIGLGGGGGSLNLTDSEIAFLQNGFSSITIGNTSSGDIDIDTLTFNDPLNLVTGGAIHDRSGTDINLSDSDAVTLAGTVAPGQSPGVLTVAGDFVFADGDTFAIEIGGNMPGTGAGFHDQLAVAGTVTIGNNVTLTASLFGGYTPGSSDQFTIVDNDVADPIVGTFQGLAEGDALSIASIPYLITYVGGTGNDVVLVRAQPPEINGGPTATFNVSENTSFVADVNSSDPEGDVEGAGLTYSISGGADAGEFSIDPSNGHLTFTVAPNFETPTDVGSSNMYDVEVKVTDSTGLMDTQSIEVTVLDVIESASLGLSKGDDSVLENSAYVGAAPSLTGTPIGSVTYSLGGADAGGGTFNAATGVVEMVGRDFESPADADSNNLYALTLTVSDDDGNTASDNFTVTVTDVVEVASLGLSTGDDSVVENSAYVGVAPSLTGTPIGDVTYSLGGTDAGLFTFNAATGVVEMVARDFENPADADGNNVYQLTLTVMDDDGNSASRDFTVSVTNVNKAPHASNQSFSTSENSADGTQVGLLAASDVDRDTLTFSKLSGSSAFNITQTGRILVGDSSQLDFETDPTILLSFQVTDGQLSATAMVTIDLNDVNEAPETSSQTFHVEENTASGTVIGTLSATDVDGDLLTFTSLTQSSVIGITPFGKVVVLDEQLLDFEKTPTVLLEFQVSDGALVATGTVTIDLSNVNEFFPLVNIVDVDGDQAVAGLDAITMRAVATDVDEGGDISERIAWTSSLDGPIGHGRTIETPLSVGTHVITARITDTGGQSSSDATTIYVPKSQVGVAISGNIWSAPPVQLRDGTIVASDSANRFVVSYAKPPTVPPTIELSMIDVSTDARTTVTGFDLTFWDGRLAHFESLAPLSTGHFQIETVVPGSTRSIRFELRPGSINDTLSPNAVENIFAEVRESAPCPDLPGDANCDGIVGFADFARIASNFNRTNASREHGDFNGDGMVNFADFAVLATNFNRRISN